MELRCVDLRAGHFHSWMIALGVTRVYRECRLRWEHAEGDDPLNSYAVFSSEDATEDDFLQNLNTALYAALVDPGTFEALPDGSGLAYDQYVETAKKVRELDHARDGGFWLSSLWVDLVRKNNAGVLMAQESRLYLGRKFFLLPQNLRDAAQVVWGRSDDKALTPVQHLRSALRLSSSSDWSVIDSQIVWGENNTAAQCVGFDPAHYQPNGTPPIYAFAAEELLTYSALAYFPSRGRRSENPKSAPSHWVRGARGSESKSPTLLSYSIWSEPLDLWGIDALLGMWFSRGAQSLLYEDGCDQRPSSRSMALPIWDAHPVINSGEKVPSIVGVTTRAR